MNYLSHIDLRSVFSGSFEASVYKLTTRSQVFGRVRLIITYFNAFSPSYLGLTEGSEL